MSSEPSVKEILNSGPKAPAKASSGQPSAAEILNSGPKVPAKPAPAPAAEPAPAAKSPPAPPKPTAVALTPTTLKDTHAEPVKFVNASGRYVVVDKIYAPKIVHDGGFVERFGRKEAKTADSFSKAKWKAKLNGAEATCGPKTGPLNPMCNYEDQTDATAAYRYFWEGKGKDRYVINYENYLKSDPSAADLVTRLVADFIWHVQIIGKNRTKFLVVSGQYSIGDEGFSKYPATVNWQRTIGAHILWVSATVTVSAKNGKIAYAAEIRIHMEDRYNFNPGGTDIGSGTIKDEENGAFEMNGWANGYMNYASVARGVTWTEGDVKSRVIVLRPVPPPDKMAKSLWE